MGVGLCANSHLEGTLAKLYEFGKSDAFKKSPSIFNLLKVPKLSLLWLHFFLSLSANGTNSPPYLSSPSSFCPQERNDVEVEKVKSTLILCYGQVALNAPPEKILDRIDQDILRSISKHFNTKVIIITRQHHNAVSVDLVI